MKQPWRSERLELCLSLCALCAAAGLGTGPASGEADGLALPPGMPVPEVRADVARLRGGWKDQILARPLFDPERKPARIGADDATDLPRLSGILLRGDLRMAIFAAGPDATRSVVVGVGSSVGAYEVKSITADGVTLSGRNGVVTVRPAFDSAARLVAPAP